VYYFEVEAESEQEALAEVAGLGGSACVTEDLVTEEIIYIEEIGMKDPSKAAEVKTWQQRCEEHPDHESGMISSQMIMDRMQEEIDDLRQMLRQQAPWWLSGA
jgi:hypothetical protein